MNCPLCRSHSTSEIYKNPSGAIFYRCQDCGMVHLDSKWHLADLDEKARYETHENHLSNPGYREFLMQMGQPVFELLPENSHGLDFGCGPSTAFSELAKEHGFSVQSYDPYFNDDSDLLKKKYDFIWCSEVVEHFNQPKKSFDLILSLFRKGSILAVMTEPCPSDEEFGQWYYHRDPTHVSFYSKKTMGWICENYGLNLVLDKGRVQLMRKM